MVNEDEYIHLKEISVSLSQKRQTSKLEIVFEDNDADAQDGCVERKFGAFNKDTHVWDVDIYVRTKTSAKLTIQQARRIFSRKVTLSVEFRPDLFGDNKTVSQQDSGCRVTVNFICGMSKSLAEVTHILGSDARTALASKVNMLGGLDQILRFLEPLQRVSPVAQLIPVAGEAVPMVIEVIASLKVVPECHKEFVTVMNDLLAILPIMESALEAIDVTECRKHVRSFIEFIKETSQYLTIYASPANPIFLLKNWYDSNKGEVDTLKEKSRRLKENVNLALSLDIKERQLLDDEKNTLHRLMPPAGSFNENFIDLKKCCMQGTRANLIETLTSFAVSENPSQRIFLLSGIAGCGKSSVATSVSDLLRQRKRLLGYFSFQSDTEAMWNSAVHFLRTLAYFVASRYKPYRKALVKVLEEDTIENYDLSIQFDLLLRQPLAEILRNSSTRTPLYLSDSKVIIIDALDKCDDPQSISSYLAEIIDLVPWLRIILTSRPLNDIEATLRGTGYMIDCDLFTVDAREDIAEFTRSRLASLADRFLHQPQFRVTEEDIQALTERSHGLFIWTTTILAHVDKYHFASRKLEELKNIISGTAANPEKELDQLYLRVLRSVAGISPDYQDSVKNFVGLIYATSRNRSLPCDGLHAFIPDATPEDIQDLQRKLSSVISVDQETRTVQVCHPSFLDFVASKARSDEFSTEPEVLDMTMARRCLFILKSRLESDERESVLSGKQQRLPPELHYSAAYWLDHLSRSQATGSNDEELTEFLNHGGLGYLLDILDSVSEFGVAALLPKKISHIISTAGPSTCPLDSKPLIRLNLLTIGQVGVGKSSLINCVFGIDDACPEDTGTKAGEFGDEPTFLSLQNRLVALHDSKDFKPEDPSSFDTVRQFVLQQQEPPLSDPIHLIWLCIETPLAGDHVFEMGYEKLLRFAHEHHVPIVIVFTQYDLLVEMSLKEHLPDSRDSTVLLDRSMEEASKTFELRLQSFQLAIDRLGIPRPPYVTVSVHQGYEKKISSLVRVTWDIFGKQAKDDALRPKTGRESPSQK